MEENESVLKIKKIRKVIGWMVPVLMVGIFGTFLSIPEMNPERNFYYFLAGVFLAVDGLCILVLMITNFRINRYLDSLKERLADE